MPNILDIITVDGNIGSGKSTVLNLLRANGWRINPEPLEQWQPYLEEMYIGTDKNSVFEFQTCVFLDRCVIDTKTTFPGSSVVMERSPFFQQQVFLKSNLSNRFITVRQYELLDRMYINALNTWSPKVSIYLRSNPEACLERIKKRARHSEDNITLEYMSKLHQLHERAYASAICDGIPVLCVDIENKKPEDIASTIIDTMNYMGVNK